MRNTIPLWILIYGGFIALYGVGAGLYGLSNPTPMSPGVGLDKLAVWGLASRNVALGLAIALALWLRHPTALAVLFAALLLVDVIDLAAKLGLNAQQGTPVAWGGTALVLGFILSYAAIVLTLWPRDES